MARLLEVLRHEAASLRVRRWFVPLMPMTGIEKTRRLFRDAGLPIPTIPEKTRGAVKGARSMAFLHPANRDVAL